MTRIPLKTALRTLVIEDNLDIGSLLGVLLGELGHEVCAIATTEAEAVHAALCHRPELIIADVQLGSGSGIAAIDRILGVRFVPHLFMSGSITKLRAIRPDAVALQKPFNESELMAAIRRVFAGAPPLVAGQPA
jgi:DNA-binding response OmpR family regulator